MWIIYSYGLNQSTIVPSDTMTVPVLPHKFLGYSRHHKHIVVLIRYLWYYQGTTNNQTDPIKIKFFLINNLNATSHLLYLK